MSPIENLTALAEVERLRSRVAELEARVAAFEAAPALPAPEPAPQAGRR